MDNSDIRYTPNGMTWLEDLNQYRSRLVASGEDFPPIVASDGDVSGPSNDWGEGAPVVWEKKHVWHCIDVDGGRATWFRAPRNPPRRKRA